MSCRLRNVKQINTRHSAIMGWQPSEAMVQFSTGTVFAFTSEFFEAYIKDKILPAFFGFLAGLCVPLTLTLGSHPLADIAHVPTNPKLQDHYYNQPVHK